MTTIRFPTGFSMSNYLGSGITAMIYLDSSSGTVVKYPHQKEDEPAIEVERQIYERFQKHGGHEGLLKYHGPIESGIRLEYASQNGLHYYLQTHKVDKKQRTQWARQFSIAIAFVHSLNVVHADLTCGNIARDHSLHARLLDFSGSSLDGSPPSVVVTASHKSPRADLKSTQAHIFALGSTLYEIMTGKPPYLGLQGMEITERFGQSKFPDTESLGAVGNIITRCWQGMYTRVDDILDAALPANLLKYHTLSVSSALEPCTASSHKAPIVGTTMAFSVVGLLVFLAHRLVRR